MIIRTIKVKQFYTLKIAGLYMDKILTNPNVRLKMQLKMYSSK